MTSKFKAAAVSLSVLSMFLVQQSVRAETQPAEVEASASNALILGAADSWDAPVSGAASDVDCRNRPDWEARQREWMTRASEWCSVEVGFRYPGAGGDIKMIVSKKDASSRSGRAFHASVDLPGNRGETSPLQFIFPCPTRAADLCLNYESTTNAGELSYDYQQLGVDAGDGAEEILNQQDVESPDPEHHPERRKVDVATPVYASDFEPNLEMHLTSLGEPQFAAPVPAPMGKLRKRAR